jgi:hypothetical protein
MTPKFTLIPLTGPASRRGVLQAMLAVPAFALFQFETTQPAPSKAEGVVEIDGWILKRSDVA